MQTQLSHTCVWSYLLKQPLRPKLADSCNRSLYHKGAVYTMGLIGWLFFLSPSLKLRATFFSSLQLLGVLEISSAFLSSFVALQFKIRLVSTKAKRM